MITPAQYIRLVKEYQKNGGVVSHAALKANMHPETAARYLKANAGPDEHKQEKGPRTYRPRTDPLKDIMPEAARYLEAAPEIEAKGLLAHLKIAKPELAGTVALRTFQSGVKVWRALNGPPKEVFFPQAHEPGRAAQFDWKRAGELGVTIEGAPFDHLLGHFVLPYSNWQRASICFSESFVSLKTGVQAGYWSLGGVTSELWTDNSSTATHRIKRDDQERTFNDAYKEFCRHLKTEPRTINVACPNEQGDVESTHRHLIRRIRTHLAIRGSSDFADQATYQSFLDQVCAGANRLRTAKVAEEIATASRACRARGSRARRPADRARRRVPPSGSPDLADHRASRAGCDEHDRPQSRLRLGRPGPAPVASWRPDAPAPARAGAPKYASASLGSGRSASCDSSKPAGVDCRVLFGRRTYWMKLQAPVRPAKPGLPSAWTFIPSYPLETDTSFPSSSLTWSSRSPAFIHQRHGF